LNPPPPVPKVKARSCGVIPAYNIQLEDVLNRKHLPPLGLKDFEEWLLYVEQCAENLYFILWLKEYTLRYRQWIVQLTPQPTNAAEYRPTWPTQTASHLSMSYACAKQTFFTPNSEYELNVPSDILAPFHTSKFGTSPPNPAVFAGVACEVQRMLRESLDRFVVAAYTNVGTFRGWCGICGGSAIALLGSVPPVVYNVVTGESRWIRLTAIPGLWLGLTIVIAALHGVCMMIYIFGDLRQLRKFELRRPPISRPRPLSAIKRYPPSQPVVRQVPIIRPPVIPPAHCTSIPPPSPAVVRDRNRPSRPNSVSSCASASSSSHHALSLSSEEPAGIQVSPSYFDHAPVVDIASLVTSADQDTPYPFHWTESAVINNNQPRDSSFAPTAAFIHPYSPPSDISVVDDDDVPAEHLRTPEQCQPLSAFDFEALPNLSSQRPHLSPTFSKVEISQPASVIIQPDRTVHRFRLSPKSLLERAQYQCNLNAWCFSAEHSPPNSGRVTPISPTSPISPTTIVPPRRHLWNGRDAAARRQARLKVVKAVPAFKSPITQVLSPIVVRAQWEIVIRSVLIGLKIAIVIVGSLLAIPVKHR